MVFWVICGLLIALALAFVLPPLRHRDRVAGAITTTDASVAVYRRQLAEMESDRRHGLVTNEQFVEDREELEQRLAVDLRDDSLRAATPSSDPEAGAIYHWLALVLPLTAILFYLLLGTPPPLRLP
jgi:cytochrome c-type biogenesis protein CcmH